MNNENISQRNLLHNYNKDTRIPFNEYIFKRDDNDIIEALKKVIISCQRNSNFTLLVQRFRVVENYDEVINILKAYENSLNKKGKPKKDNQYDFVNLKDTDLKLLLVDYYVNVKGKSRVITIIIAIPRIVNKYYFKILGNIYLPLLQIVDASTYNNNTSKNSKKPVISLRTTFTPIKISKNIYTLVDTNGGEDVKTVVYNIYIFNKSFSVFKYIFAKLGLLKTFGFLGINCIEITPNPKIDKEFYCFKKGNNTNVYISVPKYIFDRDEVVQTLTFTLQHCITPKCSYNEYFRDDFWQISLGSEFGSATVNKGLSLLVSLEGVYDIITKDIIRLPEEEKDTIYHIIRWMTRSFNDLKLKDNLDLGLKRVRWAEYMAAFYAAKLATGIYRISDNNKITIESVLKVIRIDPLYLLKSITKSNLVSYRDLGNDLDSHSASKYTFKGVSGMGESSVRTVPVVFKHVHKSHLYRVDLDSSSKSDPGRSGIFSPYIKICEDGMLSDYTEPNEWEKTFSELMDEYNFMKGRQQLASFKKELLNINHTKIIINDDDMYTMNNLVHLCSFVNNEIVNETFNLEESGVLTYGYEK